MSTGDDRTFADARERFIEWQRRQRPSMDQLFIRAGAQAAAQIMVEDLEKLDRASLLAVREFVGHLDMLLDWLAGPDERTGEEAPPAA